MKVKIYKPLREKIMQPLLVENKISVCDKFTILLNDYDKNFDNKWSIHEDINLIQAVINGVQFIDLNFKGKTFYAILKRYNSLTTQYGKDINKILVECIKLENIDEMAFNNDHTSKNRENWSETEKIFIQKLYKIASQNSIKKINQRKFSMVKMGLKGRSSETIRSKLKDLLKNNWTFSAESPRPQITNTLVSVGDAWTDLDIK